MRAKRGVAPLERRQRSFRHQKLGDKGTADGVKGCCCEGSGELEDLTSFSVVMLPDKDLLILVSDVYRRINKYHKRRVNTVFVNNGILHVNNVNGKHGYLRGWHLNKGYYFYKLHSDILPGIK